MKELKCTSCGSPLHVSEFDSNAKCEFCGAEYEIITDDNAKVELIRLKLIKEMYEDSKKNSVKAKKKKGKKSKQGCLIAVIAVVVVIAGLGIIGALVEDYSGHKYSETDWSSLGMGETVPEPESSKMYVSLDSSYGMSVYVTDYDRDAYKRYITKCKEAGFVVDSVKDSLSYTAYNSEGCYLDIWLYESENELCIRVDAPVEMGKIVWPEEGSIARLAPKPVSDYGKIQYDYSGEFCVYIGNTSKSEYLEYIENVKKAGFSKNYRNRENFFEANNGQDNYIRIEYKGFNTMYIRIDINDDGIRTLD